MHLPFMGCSLSPHLSLSAHSEPLTSAGHQRINFVPGQALPKCALAFIFAFFPHKEFCTSPQGFLPSKFICSAPYFLFQTRASPSAGRAGAGLGGLRLHVPAAGGGLRRSRALLSLPPAPWHPRTQCRKQKRCRETSSPTKTSLPEGTSRPMRPRTTGPPLLPLTRAHPAPSVWLGSCMPPCSLRVYFYLARRGFSSSWPALAWPTEPWVASSLLVLPSLSCP